MTQAIGDFAYEIGTDQGDTFSGGAGSVVYFGTGGDDMFVNEVFEGESYFVGGAGNDTYTVSPVSFTIVHETGGSDDDEFVDLITQAGGNPLIATVDDRHLLFNYPDTGGAIFFIDWELPENRIETFRLYDGSNLVGQTYDEFREIVLGLDNFIGNFAFEDLGLEPGLADDLAAVIDAVETGSIPGGLDAEEVENVALLYEAGLGRVAERDGLNFWVDQREAGLGELDLAQFFLDSEEFLGTVGDPDVLTDRELVEALYINVLGREGDENGINFWVNTAQAPGFDDDDLLLNFALSGESRDNADLFGLTEIVPGVWDFV